MARRYSINIRGDRWQYYFLSSEEYSKKFGISDDGTAQLSSTKNIIYFCVDELNFQTVIHELVHAYSRGLCLQDTSSITPLDQEEIRATFTETFYSQILQQAVQIYLKHGEISDKKKKTLSHLAKSLKNVDKLDI